MIIQLILITLISAIISGTYVYFVKKAAIELTAFPGILIGSSYTLNEVTYTETNEDGEKSDKKNTKISVLQFSLIFIMITMVWKKEV